MDLYEYFDFENKNIKRIENYNQEDLEKIVNFLMDLGSLYVIELTLKKLENLKPIPMDHIRRLNFYASILQRLRTRYEPLTPEVKKKDLDKLLMNYRNLEGFYHKDYPRQTVKELERIYTEYYLSLKKPIRKDFLNFIEKEFLVLEDVILQEKDVQRLALNYLENLVRSFYDLNLQVKDLEHIKEKSKLKEFIDHLIKDLTNYRINKLKVSFHGYINVKVLRELGEEELSIIANLDPFKYHDFQEKVYKKLDSHVPLQLSAKLEYYYKAKENYKKLKYRTSTNDSISYT